MICRRQDGVFCRLLAITGSIKQVTFYEVAYVTLSALEYDFTKNGAQGLKPSTSVRAILVPKARLSKASVVKAVGFSQRIGTRRRAFVTDLALIPISFATANALSNASFSLLKVRI